MKNLTILTIDLGTTTGWAVRSSDGLITSGTISFKPSRWHGGGMKFLRFKNWLKEIYGSLGNLDAVYFEEVRRHIGVDAAHAYGGFMAYLSAWCEEQEIPYQGVPVGSIKKHIAGKGNANKKAVIDAVKRMGHEPADDNEADAIALLYWVLDNAMVEG
nr:hypothetical protein 22 [bacterium]